MTVPTDAVARLRGCVEQSSAVRITRALAASAEHSQGRVMSLVSLSCPQLAITARPLPLPLPRPLAEAAQPEGQRRLSLSRSSGSSPARARHWLPVATGRLCATVAITATQPEAGRGSAALRAA